MTTSRRKRKSSIAPPTNALFKMYVSTCPGRKDFSFVFSVSAMLLLTFTFVEKVTSIETKSEEMSDVNLSKYLDLGKIIGLDHSTEHVSVTSTTLRTPKLGVSRIRREGSEEITRSENEMNEAESRRVRKDDVSEEGISSLGIENNSAKGRPQGPDCASNSPQCPLGRKLKEVTLDYSNSTSSTFQTESIMRSKDTMERYLLKIDEYCYVSHDSRSLAFKACIPKCSNEYPCLRKCCLPSKVIDERTRGCIATNTPWKPRLYWSAGEIEQHSNHSLLNATIYGFPDCRRLYAIELSKIIHNASPNYKLLHNGTLVHIDGHKKTSINANEFCIDGLRRFSETNSEYFDRPAEWDQIVIACEFETDVSKINKWRLPTLGILNLFSGVFLLATDIVYLLLWRHQNIHGWLQFAYATSLFCTFNSFAVVQIWSKEMMHYSKYLCKIMGWITHVTYLSAFFWLTSMNFDLWWRFSRPLRCTRLRSRETKWRKFVGFSVFSIAVPMVFSGVGIALDYKYSGLLDPPLIVPGFGIDKCYFQERRNQLPYLYGPAGILLLVDLIFFTSTVLNLRKIHAHTELARTQSTMEDKRGLRVIAKLVIVMGVLWVFELASWIAHIVFPNHEILIMYLSFPIDILNSLQGIAIWFIFVCRPNVGSQLRVIFRKDDIGTAWRKQAHITQPPSVTTVQQTVNYDYCEIE